MKIKKCPFCKSDAIAIDFSWGKWSCWRIKCPECGAIQDYGLLHSLKEAIQHWNKRI